MIFTHLKTNLKSAGFTMIELLIVMGILSVLAVGVLAAIDPIEQLNKSRDTAVRNDAANILGASERYYAVKEYFPWNTASSQANTAYPAAGSPTVTNVVAELISSSELKSSFSTRVAKYITGTQALSIHKAANQNTVYVCFKPSSKAFIEEADTRCDGTTPSDFPSNACVTSNVDDRICLP